jgi:hypothetical protein
MLRGLPASSTHHKLTLFANPFYRLGSMPQKSERLADL